MSLRILHVTPYFGDAWAYGGIPRLATALAVGLVGRGHQVTVCTTDARDRSGRQPSGRRWADGVDVLVFRNYSNRLAYELQLFSPAGLRRYFANAPPMFDIAHIHGHRHLLEVMAARWCRQRRIPYVSAPNGTAPRLERRFQTKRAWDLLWGRSDLAGADAVIAVTEAERRQLLAIDVAPERIRVVPNAIDLREFDPPPPRGRWATGPRQAPLVAFLGKLTPRKRVDVLIDAMSRLAEPRSMLVIAGNDMGSEDDARRLARRCGVESRTHFVGLLTGRRRLDLLADADVVVYPSADEVFGLVPLEALLCGTPVVVADDSGCGEIVGGLPGGQVTPLGDPRALAAAIDRVLAAPAPWRAAATEGGDRVKALYSSTAVSARVDAVYQELLGRR